MTRPLLVPSDRVRMCPEGLGTWGQSREIFQSWDTGKGAVVPARKYSVAPTPDGADGSVAVVFQDAADAEKVDQLLGSLSVRPEKPLPLRYCSSIKTFCPESSFASQRDKSCTSHVKPRSRAGPEKPSGAAKPAGAVKPAAKRPACPSTPTSPGLPADAWLFDEGIPMDQDDEFVDSASDDTAFVDIEGFDEICKPICDLGKGNPLQPKVARSPATMKPLAGPSPPKAPTTKRAPAKPKPANGTQQKKALQSFLGPADPDDIMLNMGLGGLLDNFPDSEMTSLETLDNSTDFSFALHEDPLFTQGLGKPKAKLGRPPLGSKPPGAKPKAAVPGQATFKPFSKIHKEMHKIKGGQPMLPPTPPKASPAMKSKVVWKQTVTW